MHYTVVVIPDEEGGYAADVPAIPNCFTEGKPPEDLLAIAEDAAAALLANFAAHGEEIPVEAPGATIHTIDVEVPVGALSQVGTDTFNTEILSQIRARPKSTVLAQEGACLRRCSRRGPNGFRRGVTGTLAQSLRPSVALPCLPVAVLKARETG